MWGSLAYTLLEDIAVIGFILVLSDDSCWLLVITRESPPSAVSLPVVESTHRRQESHAASAAWTSVRPVNSGRDERRRSVWSQCIHVTLALFINSSGSIFIDTSMVL